MTLVLVHLLAEKLHVKEGRQKTKNSMMEVFQQLVVDGLG